MAPSTIPSFCAWIALCLAPSCASSAFVWPSANEFQNAAWEALESPRTWGPALGASVFLVTKTDRGVSDWAQQSTPVFGSGANAQMWSDTLRFAGNRLMNVAQISHFAVSDSWNRSWKQAFVGYGSAIVATEAGWAVKKLTDRDRPIPAENSPSFPSQHAARCFAYNGQMRLTFEDAGVDNFFSDCVIFAGDLAAWGTAWARVESGSHFPSDVLAGAALGNFTAIFLQRSFLGSDPDSSWVIQPMESGLFVGTSWKL